MITDIIIDDKKTIWKYAKVSVENTKVYNCIVDKKNEFWNGWVNAYLTKDSFQEYYKIQQDYWSALKTFLLFLNILTDDELNHIDIDENVDKVLKEL